MAQKNTLPDTARHTTKCFGCCWRFAGISVPISVTLNGYQNTTEHPQSQQKIRGILVFMTIAQYRRNRSANYASRSTNNGAAKAGEDRSGARGRHTGHKKLHN